MNVVQEYSSTACTRMNSWACHRKPTAEEISRSHRLAMFRPSQGRHHEEIHQYIHMLYSQVGVDENVEGSMYNSDSDLIGHAHRILMPIEKLSGLMSRRMRLWESMDLR